MYRDNDDDDYYAWNPYPDVDEEKEEDPLKDNPYIDTTNWIKSGDYYIDDDNEFVHKSEVKYYSRKEPNRVIDEEDETYDYDDDEPHYTTYPVTNKRPKQPKIDHAERMRRAEQSKRDKIAHAKRAEEMQQLRLKIKKARTRHRKQAKLKKLLVPILIFAALLIYACVKWL